MTLSTYFFVIDSSNDTVMSFRQGTTRFVTYRMKLEEANPRIPMTIIPTTMRGYLIKVYDSHMRYPRPYCPDIISPATEAIQPMPMPRAAPLEMYGMDPGTTTC